MSGPAIARARSILVAVAVMGAVLPACGSAAPAARTTLDVRGSWDMVATADSVQYPQTLHITSEDESSGALAGTDVGAGQTFTVNGTVSGADATFTIAGGGYTADTKATVSGSGLALTMTGTFTDSNHRSGTFTARRTSAP
jgi:hypothetical protein